MTEIATDVERPDHYRLAAARFQTNPDPDGKFDTTAWVTVDSVDDENEIVLPGGCDLSRQHKAPLPLMIAHDWQRPRSFYPLPVGNLPWVTIRPRGILVGIKFARGTTMAREVKALVDEEILNGVSVGMLVQEQSALTRTEAATRADWQEAFTRTKGKVNVIRRWKLVEVSVAPVQSNPDALFERMKAKGLKRPDWLIVPANLPESPAVSSDSEADDRPATRTGFVAKHPDDGKAIDALTLEAVARVKGQYLGNVRGQSLAAIVDRLTLCLSSYLWALIYNDPSPPEGIDARLKGGCDEFYEALSLAFRSLEPLRTAPGALDAFGNVRTLSLNLDAKAKALFGDPADLIADPSLYANILESIASPADTKAFPPSGKVDPDAEADEDEDDEDGNEDEEDEDEGPIRKGMCVKCVKGLHKGMEGRVKSLHRAGMVPDVDDDVHCTKAMPGARVQCYKAMGDGHRPTDMHVGCKVMHLEKRDEFKTPARKKGIDPLALPPLTGKSDDQYAAEQLKGVAVKVREELGKQQDRMMGAV